MADDRKDLKWVTVVYEIVDHAEWDKRNPLHYEHDGLKATTVSVGDVVAHAEVLEKLCDRHEVPRPEMPPMEDGDHIRIESKFDPSLPANRK